MQSLNDLPHEVISLVLSYVYGYDLLQLEKVCRLWKELCEARARRQLRAILQYDAINASPEERVHSFVDAVRRARHVSDLSILEPVSQWSGLDPAQTDAVLNAMIELMRKRSSDAVVSSRFVQRIVSFGYSMDWTRPLDEERSATAVRATIASVLARTRFCDYGVFELIIDECHAYSTPPYFSVNISSVFPLALDFTRFTGWHVRNLEIVIAGINNVKMVATFKERLALFPRVHTVEIAMITFYAWSDAAPPSVEMVLKLNSRRCKLSRSQFVAFLDTLADISTVERQRHVFDYLDQWKNDQLILAASVTVNSATMEFVLQWRANPRLALSQQRHATDLFAARVIPALVDSLEVTVPHDESEPDRLVAHLLRDGLLRSLNEFTIVIDRLQGVGDIPRDHRARPVEQEFVVDWSSFVGHEASERMLRCFTAHLDTVDALAFTFDDKSDISLECFHAAASTSSSARRCLREIKYCGLPCFAFVLTAMSLAPKLAQLSVSTEPFGDKSRCVEWLTELLDVVVGCSQLRVLHVTVQRPPDRTYRSQQRRVRVEGHSGRSKKGDHVFLTAVERQLSHLVATLHPLEEAEVSIETHRYHFKWNRRSAATESPQ